LALHEVCCASFAAISKLHPDPAENSNGFPTGPEGSTRKGEHNVINGNGAMLIDYGGGSAAVSISNEIEPYKVKRPIGVGGMGTVDLV
jgi:hypothetical protein